MEKMNYITAQDIKGMLDTAERMFPDDENKRQMFVYGLLEIMVKHQFENDMNKTQKAY